MMFEFSDLDLESFESRAYVPVGLQVSLGFRRDLFHLGEVARCTIVIVTAYSGTTGLLCF